LGVPGHPHDDILYTSAKFSGAGDDYLGYRYRNESSPAPLHDTPRFERGGSEPSVPQAQGSSVKGGPYPGDQHSSTEQDHDSSLSDRERLGFLDSGARSQPHGTAFKIHPRFSSAQTTPVFSDEFAVQRTDPLLSLSADMVGSRGISWVPAGLTPMGVRNPGIQRAGRRGRSTSPDCRPEGERAGRKKQRHYGSREQTHVSPARIGLTQMGL